MNGKHISKYRDKGYVCDVNDIIEVRIEDVPILSMIKVDVVCDICFNKNNVLYSGYNKNINNGNFYSCKKCSIIKTKKTNLEKYGGNSPLCSEIIKEKVKKTNLKKYGVEYGTQNITIKEKTKKTNLKRYGVDNPSKSKEIIEKIKETKSVKSEEQLLEIKEKIKKTNLEKYGVEYGFQNEKIKEKIKETNLEIYGVENPGQCKEIKEKMKETSFNKYGVSYPVQSLEVKEKIKKTNLIRYGVENTGQCKEIKEKIKITKILNGNQISDELKTDFQIYKDKIYNSTLLLKDELLNKWDGYDYYDKEYIKNNFNLDRNDLSYPTIDHKISIYYGFLNNIEEEKIFNINNLCITKRTHNCKKNKLIEEEFLEKLNINKNY